LSFVDVSVLVMRCNSISYDVWMKLYHVGFVAAYQRNVSALLSSFRVGEIRCGKERSCGRGATEDDIARSDVLLEEPLILRVCWRENFLFGFAVESGANGVDVIWIVRLRIVEAHDAVSCAVKISCDNVQMVDLWAAKDQSQTDMPIGLFASSEYGDIVDRMALFEKHS